MISAARLSDFFVEVADTLVDDFDIVDFYQNLTERAAEVSGAAAVGILLSDERDQVRFMASSNASGELMELLQLQRAEGPCVDCIVTGEAVLNADLVDATARWPVFAPRAVEAGFRSVHAFPMRLRDRSLGALNLFGTGVGDFGQEEVKVVQALADIATIAIFQERYIADAEVLGEQLQNALNTRIIVEQAKGALAQAEGISVEAAFERLRSRARSSSRRLVEVAQQVLDDPTTLKQG